MAMPKSFGQIAKSGIWIVGLNKTKENKFGTKHLRNIGVLKQHMLFSEGSEPPGVSAPTRGAYLYLSAPSPIRKSPYFTGFPGNFF